MKTVVIGGGTGSFTVLRGIKQYNWNISAVVSMFDNGGSTGILRDEYGVLPPGDVRRCLVALAEEGNILRELFMHRFGANGSLQGHSFGNLFLTALRDIVGSDDKAIQKAAQILRIKGKVLPVTIDNAQLCAKFEDGSAVEGETLIDIPQRDVKLRIENLYLKPSAKLNPAVKHAIADADMIIAGPGDLYTSVIANLIVSGMSEALEKSKARKIYICNLMTKPGETTNYTASDHVKEIIKYGFKPDVVVCSDSKPAKELVKKYAEKGQHLVEIDTAELNKLKIPVLASDITKTPELVRHDSEKLANIILNISFK